MSIHNDKTAADGAATTNAFRSRQFASATEWADTMIAEHEVMMGQKSTIGQLLDQLRDGLGTADLTLEMAIAEMRLIRKTSDYETVTK